MSGVCGWRPTMGIEEVVGTCFLANRAWCSSRTSAQASGGGKSFFVPLLCVEVEEPPALSRTGGAMVVTGRGSFPPERFACPALAPVFFVGLLAVHGSGALFGFTWDAMEYGCRRRVY